jgi:putative protease
MEYDGKMFVPVAELNRMRREFLALAENELVTALRPAEESVGRAKKRWAAIAPGINTPPMTPPDRRTENLKLAVYVDRIDVVNAAVCAGCDRVYFEAGLRSGAYSSRMNTHGESDDTQLMDALAVCTGAGIPLVWKLPRITRAPELEFILSVLPGLYKDGLPACMVESTGTARAVGSALPGMYIYGSAGLNIFNHVTVRNLANQFFLLTISPELSGAEVDDLIRLARTEQCDTELELIVQGSAEAMVSEDCLLQLLSGCNEGKQKGCISLGFFGIRDSTGRVFPVRTDGLCRTHVFNAAETCLLDYIPFLLQAGIDSVAIDARGRTAAYAREMVHIYREAIIKARQHNTGIREGLIPLKKRVKEIALGGITAGHFERGLKKSRDLNR